MDGQLIGHFLGFRGKDDVFDDYRVLEITDAVDGATEIAWDEGKVRVYMRFRHSDFVRALREFKERT